MHEYFLELGFEKFGAGLLDELRGSVNFLAQRCQEAVQRGEVEDFIIVPHVLVPGCYDEPAVEDGFTKTYVAYVRREKGKGAPGECDRGSALRERD